MITVYSADWCAPCTTLKAYLDRKGVKYRVKDADDQTVNDELIALAGARLLPTTVINGVVIPGLNWRAIHNSLEEI